MSKPKFCKWEKEPCEDERTNYPGKSILSQYCKYHLALSHIYKKREEAVKDKEELDKVRQTSIKHTPRELFYSSAAWRNFSHYVLLFYADDNLEVRCSTNNSYIYRITDRRICVGHFIKVFDQNSTNYATAFDFRNVLPQSDQENRYKNGNEPEMEKSINRIHGEGTADILRQLKHEPFKLDKYTLDKISKKYLKLFNEELTRRKISNPWKSRKY